MIFQCVARESATCNRASEETPRSPRSRSHVSGYHFFERRDFVPAALVGACRVHYLFINTGHYLSTNGIHP